MPLPIPIGIFHSRRGGGRLSFLLWALHTSRHSRPNPALLLLCFSIKPAQVWSCCGAKQNHDAFCVLKWYGRNANWGERGKLLTLRLGNWRQKRSCNDATILILPKFTSGKLKFKKANIESAGTWGWLLVISHRSHHELSPSSIYYTHIRSPQKLPENLSTQRLKMSLPLQIHPSPPKGTFSSCRKQMLPCHCLFSRRVLTLIAYSMQSSGVHLCTGLLMLRKTSILAKTRRRFLAATVAWTLPLSCMEQTIQPLVFLTLTPIP